MDRPDDIFSLHATLRDRTREVEMSLAEYLAACRDDPKCYASPAERMLRAIGEPEIVDSSRDPRLGRLFLNRTIRLYPAFADFHGMEETIERIVGFFRHAAQGLEERKQVLYLLGPVGGGKSSLGERLKALMEKEPIYVLKAGNELSPVFESPLGLFDPETMGDTLARVLRHSAPRADRHRQPLGAQAAGAMGRRSSKPSAWSSFTPRGASRSPSPRRSPATTTTRTSRRSSARSISASWRATARTTRTPTASPAASTAPIRGILEFVEMFKAPIKMLHPLLTATQEGNYLGTENIGAIPFQGIILAHSNEAEWQSFRNNRTNEAFLDRVSVVKVPYCLRVTEESKIYQKLISGSALAEAPCAPHTLEMLARFAVLSRLKPHANSKPFAKMRVYDGENIRETDPKVKTMQEYRDTAGVDEGMDGISTRFAYKVLSATFNHSSAKSRRIRCI